MSNGIKLPIAGASAAGIVTTGAQTVAGAKTFSGIFTPSAGIVGANGSSVAASGHIGEVVYGTSTGGNAGIANSSLGTTTGVVQLPLTPGIWLIMAEVHAHITTTTGDFVCDMDIRNSYSASGSNYVNGNLPDKYTNLRGVLCSGGPTRALMTKNHVTSVSSATTWGVHARITTHTGTLYGRAIAVRIG